MNWKGDDQNAKNIVWSERCRREGKGVRPDLWHFEVTSQEQFAKTSVGPGSINNRSERFINRTRPLLAAMSAYVQRSDTEGARYVQSFSDLRQQKVGSPSLWAVSPSRRAAAERQKLEEKTSAPRVGAGTLPSLTGDEPAMALPASSKASPFGTSLFTTSSDVVGPRRQRQGFRCYSALSNDNTDPGADSPHRTPSPRPPAVDSATAAVMAKLAEKEAGRRAKKLRSATSGDYGWQPSAVAGERWRDARFYHPLPHTDATRKFT